VFENVMTENPPTSRIEDEDDDEYEDEGESC